MKGMKIDWKEFRAIAIFLFGLLLYLGGCFYALSERGPENLRFWLSTAAVVVGIWISNHFRDNIYIAGKKNAAESDERHTALRNRAKAKAFDLVMFLVLAFSLLWPRFENQLYAFALLSSLWPLGMLTEWLYRKKYEREM